MQPWIIFLESVGIYLIVKYVIKPVRQYQVDAIYVFFLCSYLKSIVKIWILGNGHHKWLFHYQSKVSLQSLSGRQKNPSHKFSKHLYICMSIYLITSIPTHGWMSSMRTNQHEIEIKQKLSWYHCYNNLRNIHFHLIFISSFEVVLSIPS